MLKFKAKNYPYNIILGEGYIPYPFLRDSQGDREIYCVSPLHGRSFVIVQNEGRWIVSKGNGLSYSKYTFLDTSRIGDTVWGALFKENAIRDYIIGQEIAKLGIKTNLMEYVLEIDTEMRFANISRNDKPYLLQYSVECPYRICDFAFMPMDCLKKELSKWKKKNGCSEYYISAANLLIRNLRIMHDNNIMHNAIHVQNYTWALELVDFESARTETTPYDNKEYEEYYPLLMESEFIQTYEVINYIAWCLGEKMNNKLVDALFMDYGFCFNYSNVSKS
jgi:hypothetical protein